MIREKCLKCDEPQYAAKLCEYHYNEEMKKNGKGIKKRYTKKIRYTSFE